MPPNSRSANEDQAPRQRHTAVALAALEKLVATGRVRAADRVIVVSTAGLKSAEFKTGYHTGRLPGIAPRQPSGRSYSRIFFLGVSRTFVYGVVASPRVPAT
jgi:hypothetical protein